MFFTSTVPDSILYLTYAFRSHLEASTDQWKRLHLSLQELLAWLQLKEDELKQQAPIGGDLPTVQKQNDIHRVCLVFFNYLLVIAFFLYRLVLHDTILVGKNSSYSFQTQQRKSTLWRRKCQWPWPSVTYHRQGDFIARTITNLGISED